MTIFRIKNDKANYLVINLCYKEANNTEINEDFSILKNDHKIVGINIFNLNNFPCQCVGMIYPTVEIINWIKQITNINLEVNNLFIIAKVQECIPIEKTHLHQCVVTDGKNNFQVVCGAKNISTNINVVFAKIGAIFPNGMQILPKKLGNGISEGMICSKKELGLENESYGIWIVDNNWKIGNPLLEIYANKNMLKS